MMIGNKPWKEIIPAFAEELRRCQYPVSNVSCLMAKVNEAQTYAMSQGIDEYSIELGQQFLSKFYPMSGQFRTWKDIDSQTREAFWSVGLLNDLLLHGFFTTTKRSRVIPLNPDEEALLLNFQKSQIENGFASSSAKRHTLAMRPFLTYLASNKITLSSICSKDIVGFLSCYIDKGKSYINTIIASLKRLSKFLYVNELTKEDIAIYIPPLNKMVSPRVPSVWDDSEIDKMLGCVDRGSPLGKRDYAMLILAIKLGLRCSDIKALQFSDIDWEKQCISITQRKTGKPLTLPFSNDVGWAVIDYIKNARPKSDFQNIFLTHSAPIKPFAASSSLYNMISRYRTIAGIDLHENARRGMHSLRHSFATNLLRKGIPLETIAEMLGHVGMSSVDVYLSVETEELRSIALNPEEVYHNEQVG